MTYQRITLAKKCIHKISIHKRCIKCMEHFIHEKQTEIKILREGIAIIKRREDIRNE